MTSDAHLLIVDDDERIRTLLQKFLIRNGFLVSAARDAAHARRILSGLDFDLIVLDVMMPGEDGLSLCRMLRETSETPVIMLTAMVEETDRVVGLEIGADDYVTKPFSPRELLARITSYTGAGIVAATPNSSAMFSNSTEANVPTVLFKTLDGTLYTH